MQGFQPFAPGTQHRTNFYAHDTQDSIVGHCCWLSFGGAVLLQIKFCFPVPAVMSSDNVGSCVMVQDAGNLVHKNDKKTFSHVADFQTQTKKALHLCYAIFVKIVCSLYYGRQVDRI